MCGDKRQRAVLLGNACPVQLAPAWLAGSVGREKYLAVSVGSELNKLFIAVDAGLNVARDKNRAECNCSSFVSGDFHEFSLA
jgi:hypothetical protein